MTPQAQDAHAAALEALEEVVLHDLAREEWDEQSGLHLAEVNADGSFKCAGDCRGCAAEAYVLSLVAAVREAEARAERAERRASKLNRRATQAEAVVMQTVEDCKRQGVSVGRALANSACNALIAERDALAARLAAVSGEAPNDE